MKSENKATSSLSIGEKLVCPTVTRWALALVRKVQFVSMLSPEDIKALGQAFALIDGDKEDTLVALLHVAIPQKYQGGDVIMVMMLMILMMLMMWDWTM